MNKYCWIALVLVVALLAFGCSKGTSSLTGAAVGVPADSDVQTTSKTTESAVSEVKVATGNKVSMLGKAGFEPMELTVTAGNSVTWINQDPKEKIAVITFQKDYKSKMFITSNQIKFGEEYTHNFDEAGTYDYWVVGYGVMGKLIVTQ